MASEEKPAFSNGALARYEGTQEQKIWPKLSMEDSDKAVEALAVLSNLGLIHWRESTAEEDDMGIEIVGELKVFTHDGHCLSPYMLIDKTYVDVGMSKTLVRSVWNWADIL